MALVRLQCSSPGQQRAIGRRALSVYGAVGVFGVAVQMHWLIAQQVWLAGVGSALMLTMGWRIARQPPRPWRESEMARAPLARLIAGTLVLTQSSLTTILSFLAASCALGARWQALVGKLLAGKFPDFRRVHWNGRHPFARRPVMYKTIRDQIATRESLFRLPRDRQQDFDTYLALTSPVDFD